MRTAGGQASSLALPLALATAFQRSAARLCISEQLNLFAYRRLIARKISRELRQLRGEQASQRKDKRKGQYGYAHDRQSTRHADTLQDCNYRRQDKAEKNR